MPSNNADVADNDALTPQRPTHAPKSCSFPPFPAQQQQGGNCPLRAKQEAIQRRQQQMQQLQL